LFSFSLLSTDTSLVLPSFPTRRSSDLDSDHYTILLPIQRPCETGRGIVAPILSLIGHRNVASHGKVPDSCDHLIRTNMKTNISIDRKSTRLNSSHVSISNAVFCLKKKS